MRRALFVCLFLLACAAVVHAQVVVNYTVVVPEGRRISIETYRLNGRDYAPLSEIARSFFRGSDVEDNGRTILWQDEELRAAPASFYVLRNSDDGTRMAQMPYPAVDIRGETCLPVLPLCSAVEALGLYETDVRGTVITLRRFTHRATALLFPESVYEEEEFGEVEEQVEHIPSGDVITGLNAPDDEDELPRESVQSTPATKRIGRAVAPSGNAAARIGAISAPAHGDADTRSPEPPKGAISGKRQTKSSKQAPAVQPHTTPSIDTTDAQPGRYNIPRDLYRRELLDDSSRSFLDAPTLPDAGPPIASLLWPEPAPGLEIISMDVDVRTNAVNIVVEGSGALENYQRPECDGRQLVLRFPGVRNGIAAKTLKKLGSTSPLVSVRSEQVGTILVYKIAFAHKVEKCTFSRKSSARLMFSVQTATGNAPTQSAASEAKKWALDVIVLDAGHGGKDVGAIGVTGCYEKDITLAIVKKLGALIERNLPETKVVYTRKDDRFVELYRRGQIANEAGGKLFISIHCNSMPTKPHSANGFETYILRPGRNEDAVRVAERENDAIRFESNQKRYKALTDEQFIVVNMAQSAFVKFSELFASTVQNEVGESTSLESRGVNQAGFYVLVGASMPNILFETAFLSNTDDEKFINSDRGQDAVARGLLNAIRIYAAKYQQVLDGQR